MKKVIVFKRCELNEYYGYIALQISVNREEAEWLSREFSLLLNSVISILNIRVSKNFEFEFSYDKSLKFPKISSNANIHRITFEQNSLECFLGFLLDYVQDGYCSVNHIDIELENARKPGYSDTITLKVDHSKRPMSSEEALKILMKKKS